MARETLTLAPHQPHLFRSTEHLALWRCDEAAATALVDAAGSFTTTLGTLPAVASGLFTSPAGASGARTFNGTTTFASAPGNGTAQSLFALSGGDGAGYAVEAWVRFGAVNVEQCIIAYGGTTAGETLAGNALMSLRLAATGKLRLFWEFGAGTDQVVDAANMAALVANKTYHVGVVVRRRATTIEVEFYVNDVLVDRITGISTANVAAGGTTTPLFVIGRYSDTAEATLFLNGTVDDIRVTSYAPSQCYIRDGYARGARNFDCATMYASGSWESHAWVYAEWTGAAIADFDRGVGYLDLGNVFGHNHVLEVEHSEDVDNQGMTATVKLRRQVFKQNIAPNFAYGALNDSGFMGLMRRIKIETADVPLGYGRAAAAAFRQPAFEGVVRKVPFASPSMPVECTDRIRGLQIAWCKPADDGTGVIREQQFAVADESMEQLIIDMLTAFKPAAGYKVNDNDQGSGTFLGHAYFPAGLGGASFNIKGPYGVMNKNVAQAIEDVVTQIGWRARYVWDDTRKEFRLTVYGVNRAATWSAGKLDLTNQAILDWTTLDLDDEAIRNNIDVDHQEAASTSNTGEWGRFLSNAQDATSISKYGERYGSIAIGSVNNISDAATAAVLATAILADLKDPKDDATAVMLPRLGMDVEDMVRARADLQRFAVDTDFAVSSVKYTYTKSERRMELGLRNGAPIAGHNRWFDRFVTAKGHRKAAGRRAPTTPAAPGLTAIAEGLLVKWTLPVNLGNRRYRWTEVHASTTVGFTPSSATLKRTVPGDSAVLKGLDPTQTWFVKLLHADGMANPSVASSQAAAPPRYMPKTPGVAATRPSNTAVAGKTNMVGANANTTESNDFFNNYDNSTGANGGYFVAPVNGWYVASAGATVAGTGVTAQCFIHWMTAAAGAQISEVAGVATGSGASVFAHVGATMYLVAGQAVRWALTVTGTSPVLQSGGNTFFAVSSIPDS